MKQTGTIFDALADEPPSGQKGFFEAAKSAPTPKEKSFINDMKEYSQSLLKGAIEGVSAFGLMMGPTITGKSSAQQQEEQTETLNKLLPTEPTLGKEAIRRGAKILPTAAAFPAIGGAAMSAGQSIVRSALAGAGAETVKAAGGGELAQSIAEMAAFSAPDITKNLIESGSKADLIKSARALGLTDKEITPLIQEGKLKNYLMKVAPKTGRTAKLLEETKQALGQARQRVVDQATNTPLSTPTQETLLTELTQVANALPADVRKAISADMQDLVQEPITSASLMNLWADINHVWRKEPKVGQFKGPIRKALQTADPELAKDFDTINELYTKFYPIAAKLKPQLKDQIIEAVEYLGLAGGLIQGAMFGNWKTAGGMVAEHGLRTLSRELLINPKLQQLLKKTGIAMNQGKFALGAKAINEINAYIREMDDDFAPLTDDITEEEFKMLFHQS